ncbi:DUF3850 domain-containing protein [Sporolactobacillus pectinivorans]|uniref:DUF3850 domain-containing protein n=1 Tax=Sporolactobacillus pectinivorans TaxID=1591408 RepID=UPI000C2678A7|nr:DUF3850 domain-containing protein [Sporolactobacillus pectinivorans]
MAIHEIKILPEYFAAVVSGDKTFEIRKNDHDYKLGDTVTLNEWTKEKGYTGYRTSKTIGYITDFEQKPGFVVFSLK